MYAHSRKGLDAQVEIEQLLHATHVGAPAEGVHERRLGTQRHASQRRELLRSLSARFRRQQPVEADIARERRVQRVGLVAAARRRERARLPVAPRRFLSFRIGQRGNAGQHVGPRPHAQRGADAPRDLVERPRRRAGLAEPVERRGLERACRVIRETPAAVRAVLGRAGDRAISATPCARPVTSLRDARSSA
jgi:hypothetical protein